jgi:hypothetical protein
MMNPALRINVRRRIDFVLPWIDINWLRNSISSPPYGLLCAIEIHYVDVYYNDNTQYTYV